MRTGFKCVLACYVACLLAFCSGCSATDNSALTEITVDGERRSYRVFVPPTLPQGQAVPLVLVYHGGLGNAERVEGQSRMNEVAAEKGFIAVYPNGTGQRRFADRRTWNAGICCGYSAKRQVDDVAFTRQLLDKLEKTYPVDVSRIYATGISNGAMFTYRLACEMPERFAAIAPVSGTLAKRNCRPAQGVAVMHVHGTADRNVPVEGGMGARSIAGVSHQSVETSLAAMRAANRCTQAEDEQPGGNNVVLHLYNCEGKPVEYLQIIGGAHEWALGSGATKARDLSLKIWNFFDTQTLTSGGNQPSAG